MLLGAGPLVLLALLVPERATDWTFSYLGILGFMSVASTALCWWLWIYILDRVPAWEASLSVLGTPVVAILTPVAISLANLLIFTGVYFQYHGSENSTKRRFWYNFCRPPWRSTTGSTLAAPTRSCAAGCRAPCCVTCAAVVGASRIISICMA